MANLTNTFYASEGIHGYGTQLLVGNGATPETFEAVAQIDTITPGDMTTAKIEKTHLRSPAAHREYLLGLRDSGPFVCTGQWRPRHESQSRAGGGSGSFTSGGLLAIWIARTERNYKISIPDTSPAYEFPIAGGLTKFQPGEIGINNLIPFTAEVSPLRDFSASLP